MTIFKLKVAEAIQDDVNKGIVRVDSNVIHELGLRPGDIIEIKGEKATVCIVDRAYPGDIGLKIIRMDGLTRRNAKTGIGEMVEIKKADVKEAKKVIIAPAHQGISVKAPPIVFKQGLLGRAMLKGDLVSLGGAKRRKMAMSDSPIFNEIFNIMNESFQGIGFGGDLKFVVADASPSGPVIISETTVVEFNPTAVEVEEEESIDVSYEDIGGLQEEISKIREMVELPLKHPEIFEQLGIEPPNGVLLHGPPGTGKTLLARAVANETNSHFIVVNGPEVMSKFYGESEANLRKIFEEAEKNAPSIIFFDEIDAIATNREESKGEVERRVVAQLLSIMDGLKSRGKVVVIAATNIPNSLDPALRRPGRFDRELEINPPNKEGRLTILKIHTRNMPLLPTFNLSLAKTEINNELKDLEDGIKGLELKDQTKNVIAAIQNRKDQEALLTRIFNKVSKMKQKEFAASMEKTEDNGLTNQEKAKLINLMQKETLEDVADMTHGFVGADLAALSRETAMVVLRKVLPDLDLEEEKEIPQEVLEKLKITKDDFKEALKYVRPSAMREVLIEVPNIKWDSIGGLEDVKQDLKEAVEWPLKHPEAFKKIGVRPPRGILLYGPPGTGKTLMAKAVANESGANFITVKGSELLSKWVNETPQLIKKLFQKARQVSPCIIFIDEIDTVASRRGSVDNERSEGMSAVNQLLTEIDGVEEMNDVMIIGATNRPDRLDPALLRPGRFDRLVLTPTPDAKSREKIFEIHTKPMTLSKNVDIKKMAVDLEGYAGADIESVCREAAMRALRKDIKAKEVTGEDFKEALEIVRPSITKEIKQMYKELQNKLSTAKSQEMKSEMANYFG